MKGPIAAVIAFVLSTGGARCGIQKPFEVATAFNSRLLDPAIKMNASKVGP